MCKHEHALRDIVHLLDFLFFWLVAALDSAGVGNLVHLVYHRNNLIASTIVYIAEHGGDNHLISIESGGQRLLSRFKCGHALQEFLQLIVM